MVVALPGVPRNKINFSPCVTFFNYFIHSLLSCHCMTPAFQVLSAKRRERCGKDLRSHGFFFLHFFGCVGSSLLRAGFLQLRGAGATLHCAARASHCGGFSCCGAQVLGAGASIVVARRLSSCGARALLLRGMWDLPGPGIEPVSPALAGGFLTTAPPGKSDLMDLKHQKNLQFLFRASLPQGTCSLVSLPVSHLTFFPARFPYVKSLKGIHQG